ncbi:uncharacterized protein isoform X2 [Musca autumnalis]|uniref:uncharacterized protein isoform X2 n=1 Tax=Musca autumnalis TaxID=221902 RepID=UPI003CEEF040
MLLLLFRNCCRILWKLVSSSSSPPHHCHKEVDQKQKKLPRLPLSYNHHYQQRQEQHYHFILWFSLLVLLSQHHGIDCRPASETNHRAQRRFMWKQMDTTVDGFVGRMVTGARMMKGMIGEFIPQQQLGKQNSGNALDYLPTETTRIRYIIRNPLTKETKVIKMRPSKKVIKLMAMTPKPILAEKTKSMYILENGKLRQLEKEQELIAEGKLPAKHEERMPGSRRKPNATSTRGHHREQLQNAEIVNGVGLGGQDFGENWKPIFKDPPENHLNVRPSMMSLLHTNIVGELLPQPQKQVYDPKYESIDYEEMEREREREFERDRNKAHTYEVTEYTAEESVMQPLTHDYYSYTHVPISGLTLRGVGSAQREPLTTTTEAPSEKNKNEEETHDFYSYRHVPVASLSLSQRGLGNHYTATPKEAPHAEEEEHKEVEEASSEKVQITEYRTHRVPPPPTRGGSSSNYRYHAETTTSLPSTTTTEEPNYPPAFLKKMRERPDSLYVVKPQQPRNKPKELVLENTWIPSNVSYETNNYHHNKPAAAAYPHTLSSVRIKSQKWPPDVQETHNSDSSNHHATEVASASSPGYESNTLSSSSSALRNTGNHSRKNVRLKTHEGGNSSPISSHTSTSSLSSSPSSGTTSASSSGTSNIEYHRHRHSRHRGSIRFGDKLETDEG